MNSSSGPSINIIERTEGLSGEPLITQWLAHLLCHPQYREAIIRYLYEKDFESTALDGLKIEDETGSADGDGRPDLRIVGDEIYLIVENKFGAPRTENQPDGYLRELRKQSQRHKSLIFLVPCWRETEMSDLIRRTKPNIPVRVKLWEELVTKLAEKFPASELMQEFVGEIRRRCKVMKPLDDQELKETLEGLRRFLRHQEFLKGLRLEIEKSGVFGGKGIKLTTEK